MNDDAISRTDAIRVASGYCHWTNIPDELAKLPSVNPIPCEDAISRQAVLNILDDMVREYIKENDFDKAQGVAWVKVQRLPSVSTEKTGRWISVSERLPEESGRYLAYIVNKHDDKLQYIMTCDYSVDGYWNWFPDDETASDNVVAWMPLPKPYKAESEVEE